MTTITASRRAEFVARVTADVTHELRNVLAIVKETAGLVDDIMTFSESNARDDEKIIGLLGRIEPQAERGTVLTTVLNHLARAARHTDCTTDLNQITSDVAVMCHRIAKKRRQSVKALPCDHKVSVTGDRLNTYMMLHAATEYYLDLLPESTVLSIAAHSQAGTAAVDLTGSLNGSAVQIDVRQTSVWHTLHDTATAVGARLEPDGHLRILFQTSTVDGEVIE